MSVTAPTGFETVKLVEKLSDMITLYFQAYAQDKVSHHIPPEKTIHVRPHGKLLRKHIRVWLIEPTFWYVVDAEGNGYDRSVSAESGEYAKALNYDFLRRQSVEKLQSILKDFDPWRNTE